MMSTAGPNAVLLDKGFGNDRVNCESCVEGDDGE